MKDRVIYKERKDFVAWCYDMKIFIQGIPDSVEDSMKIGYIKRTIENKDLKEALQICKTSSEVLTTIAERHIDDKNIISDLFKPIYGAKMPTNYTICFKNIEIVMRILNLLQTIGMMSRIQINEYDECLPQGEETQMDGLHSKQERR